MAGTVCGTSDRRQADRPPDPEMAEGGSDGARPVERDEGRESARGGDFARACEPLPALRLGSVGGGVAEEAGARGCYCCALCGRCRAGIRAPRRSGALPGAVAGTAAEIRAGTTPGENAPDRIRAIRA